jgi:hypothetical protein
MSVAMATPGRLSWQKAMFGANVPKKATAASATQAGAKVA